MTLFWYFVSILDSKFDHLVTCTVSTMALTLVLACYLIELSYQRINASYQELQILRYERYCIYTYYFCWYFTSNLASKYWLVSNMCLSGLPICLWLQYLLGSILRYHTKASMHYISNCGHLDVENTTYTNVLLLIFYTSIYASNYFRAKKGLLMDHGRILRR